MKDCLFIALRYRDEMNAFIQRLRLTIRKRDTTRMSLLKSFLNALHSKKTLEPSGGSVPSAAPVTAPADSEKELNGIIRYRKSDDHIVITGCSAKAEAIEIPAEIEGLPVTVIEHVAFFQDKFLKHVVIPDSVTLIDYYAFAESGLKSVTMSNAVKNIGSGAFKNCHELTDITFPDSLQTIGADAFCMCKSLRQIILPASLKTLGETSIFAGCYSLESVTFRGGIEVLPGFTFSDCSALTEIILPDSLKEIKMSVFHDCTALEEIRLPSSMQTIGLNAFAGCSSLKEIRIPASVTLIREGAFYLCSSLSSVIIENPECEIEDSGNTILNRTVYVDGKRVRCFDGTIYGATGSAAQAYAEKYGYLFVCSGRE